ncbi:MAG: ATPase [Paenibacillus sp.]|jgi:uncharacterized protein YndB with AHSA1/START domain|nr:ATPase [Paenibacillus sp.]
MSSFPRHTDGKLIGQTASTGFQIGVRRTLPISRQEAWDYMMSPEGLRLWIGDVPALDMQPGSIYESKEGNRGEMRVVKLHEQLRLTWQPKKWERSSTLQIRFLPAASGKTTISFHQEKLDGPMQREEMKLFWEDVIARIAEATVRKS